LGVLGAGGRTVRSGFVSDQKKLGEAATTQISTQMARGAGGKKDGEAASEKQEGL